MSGWISVKDKLPTQKNPFTLLEVIVFDGRFVFTCLYDKKYGFFISKANDSWDEDHNREDLENILFWQNLPKPPKTEDA